MSEASRWRFALGRHIGLAYAANPKARVVMIAGSTGRGTADRYSDLEIDVYWSEPPTDEERRAAAEGAGGHVLSLYPYEEDEWAEEIEIGGFHLHTSTFLAETMERYLRQVVDEHSTEMLPQMRLFSLLHARPLTGEDLVVRWRARAAAYPDALVHAMLRANLPFEGLGYAEDMLVARDDLLALYDLICGVERRVLGVLLGLNRIYLPDPAFKRMDELIAEMRLTPADLSARLKAAFRLPPESGVATVHGVCEDTLTLVETHVPDFAVNEHRAMLRRRRGVWERPPEV